MKGARFAFVQPRDSEAWKLADKNDLTCSEANGGYFDMNEHPHPPYDTFVKRYGREATQEYQSGLYDLITDLAEQGHR